MSEQEKLFDERDGRNRRDDWVTSREGAANVAYRAGSQKAKLVAAYQNAYPFGLTDEEAANEAGLSPLSCYWKRCGELRQDNITTVMEGVSGVITREGKAGINRIVSVWTGRE